MVQNLLHDLAGRARAIAVAGAFLSFAGTAFAVPTAVINPNPHATVNVGDSVSLDGSSSDPGVGGLTITNYEWDLPPGTIVQNSGISSFNFTAPAVSGPGPQTITVQLIVQDFFGVPSDPVTDTFRVNRKPAANAGPDQSVIQNTVVNLDGTASTDADGDTLAFSWTQISGTAVTLNNGTTASPSFTAPLVGPGGATLVFRVSVNDGNGGTNTDTINVIVTNGNHPPVANAGPDQSVTENTLVNLNGSGTTDPDVGDVLSYAWLQLSGPGVTLNNANTVTPSFTAPAVSSAGATMNFRLTVNDGNGGTSTDNVIITVNNLNQPPVANDQSDTTAEDTPKLITLTASDADGNPLTYTIVSPPVHCTITAISGANVTYIPCPDYFGTDSFTFKANDGLADSNVATVYLTITPVNDAPIANAGVDQTRVERSTVTLNGSATDVDSPPADLTFAWTQLSGPLVTLSNPALPNPTFLAPEVLADSDLVFLLTVTDSGIPLLSQPPLSSSDTVTVSILNFVPGNNPPTHVNAGPDEFVSGGAEVPLRATADDPDGDPLVYKWKQIGGPAVTISTPIAQNTTFLAPVVSADTVLTFQVTVSDGRGGVTTDSVVYVVRDPAQVLLLNPLLSDVAVFPSPFSTNSGATIRYQLRNDATVDIVIVDLFGRQVRAFSTTSGVAGGAAGNNEVHWDGKNGEGNKVGNGAYVVQIKATDAGGSKGKALERVGVRN